MAISTLFQNTEIITTTLVPPDSYPFDISPDYLQRATEGARAWKRRQHRLSDHTRGQIRVGCALGGIALSALCWFQPAATLKPIAWFAWLTPLILGEITMAIVEYRHDAHLKLTVFDPRYNPNPKRYRKYARAYAKYESEVRKVYGSPQGIYHSNNTCGKSPEYTVMPRWKAISKNIKPCPRCGRVPLSPRRLPPPFGNGRLPPE